MSECDWTNHEAIDTWCDEYRKNVAYKTFAFTGKNDPDEELRHRLAQGVFQGKNKTSVEAYLAAHDRAVYRVSEEARVDREERMLDAAESSASAAQDSARHARFSEQWAWGSFVTALGALALSAWPYIREYWLP